jgi:hypothetical protein
MATRATRARWVEGLDDFDLRMQQDHINALTGQADLAVLTSKSRTTSPRTLPAAATATRRIWSLSVAVRWSKEDSGVDGISGSNAWSWPRIRAEDEARTSMDVTALSLRQRDSS